MSNARGNWQKALEPFHGKRCVFPIGLGKDFSAYVFDPKKDEKNADELFGAIIDDWAHVKEHLGKDESTEFVLFASRSDDDNEPFAMVTEILFYDRATGETYYYEEGSYEAVTGANGKACRLDELQMKVAS